MSIAVPGCASWPSSRSSTAAGSAAASEVAIGADETLSELRSRLTGIGTGLLLDALADGFGPPVPQQGEPRYAARIAAPDGSSQWITGPEAGADIHRLRACSDAIPRGGRKP